jgi:hypothetical protein
MLHMVVALLLIFAILTLVDPPGLTPSLEIVLIGTIKTSET